MCIEIFLKIIVYIWIAKLFYFEASSEKNFERNIIACPIL
jgi:hypothetical protein